MVKEVVGLLAEGADEEDEIGGGGVVGEGVLTMLRAQGQQGGELSLFDGGEVNVHSVRVHCAGVREGCRVGWASGEE